MTGSTTWPAGIPSPTDPRIAAALTSWVAAAKPDDHAGALAAVVARVADAAAVDVALTVGESVVDPDLDVLQVGVDPDLLSEAGPWLPGFLREALLSAGDRRRGGVHHTSPALASTLIDVVASVRPFGERDVILDPAVGGGVFLVAACEALSGDRAHRVRQVRGIDIDPLAIATTRASLRLWAGGAALDDDAFLAADALTEPWPLVDADVVVGNPPFLSQLRDGTTRSDERRTALAERWPELGGYVDDAAAFLLAGVDQVSDGGVVALVQPASFLSARDALPVRARLRAEAAPVALWIDGTQQFSAAVDTVAVVVQRGATPGAVQRARGVPAETLPMHPPVDVRSWASLLLVGAPAIDIGDFSGMRTLADVAHVTAGFRDQFYGLRGAVFEAAPEPEESYARLITSGLIDPLSCRWGESSCRFDKQRWQRPLVDPAKVDPAIGDWVAARLVPKLVVASQTKVLEVVVDAAGDMVPCTPVVSVEPLPGAPSLEHLAAALTSPLASLLLLNQAAGSALSADAMRVSASSLGELPLPPEGPAWDDAAAAISALDGWSDRAELIEVGRLALAAHGLSHRTDILNWWHSRLRGR